MYKHIYKYNYKYIYKDVHVYNHIYTYIYVYKVNLYKIQIKKRAVECPYQRLKYFL